MVNKLVALLGSAAVILAVVWVGRLDKAEEGLTDFRAMAKAINEDKKSTWRADPEAKIPSPEELKKMFNLIIEKKKPENFDEAPEISLNSDDLPANFHPREKWGFCPTFDSIRDQSSCGSCWAVAAASAMTDRRCIATAGAESSPLSAEDLLECCLNCGYGCNGGFLYQSWSYAKSSGLVSGDKHGDSRFCMPYMFPQCNHHGSGPFEDCDKHHYVTPPCSRACHPEFKTRSYVEDKVKLQKSYSLEGAQRMMRDIYTNGPVEASFTVYEDFLLYKSGIYVHSKGKEVGSHAVKVLGWGEENGVKFWLVANSWNENWGEKGFFRIFRGNDHCDIESDVAAGIF